MSICPLFFPISVDQSGLPGVTISSVVFSWTPFLPSLKDPNLILKPYQPLEIFLRLREQGGRQSLQPSWNGCFFQNSTFQVPCCTRARQSRLHGGNSWALNTFSLCPHPHWLTLLGPNTVDPTPPRGSWLTRRTHGTPKSCCTHGQGLLQDKYTACNQQRQKAQRAESRRDEVPSSSCPRPVQWQRQCWVLPATM